MGDVYDAQYNTEPFHSAPLSGQRLPVGMTLRDYFAAAVLTGMAANKRYITELKERYGPGTKNAALAAAGECYRIADAMLKAREGK